MKVLISGTSENENIRELAKMLEFLGQTPIVVTADVCDKGENWWRRYNTLINYVDAICFDFYEGAGRKTIWATEERIAEKLGILIIYRKTLTDEVIRKIKEGNSYEFLPHDNVDCDGDVPVCAKSNRPREWTDEDSATVNEYYSKSNL